MCGIVGYSGAKQAAPILLEMLRRQENYDGGMSVGVATIHEGKLYCKKVVGDVDNFLANVDLSELPGTIGMAHTRPAGGDSQGRALHPFLSMDGRTASVTNGTSPKTKYWASWDEAAQQMLDQGVEYRHIFKNPKGASPKLPSGEHISPAELRVHLEDYYLKQGMPAGKTLALTCQRMYSDNVTVMLTEYFPEQITLLRATRPMVCVTEKGETYIATTRFGLPEEIAQKAFDLPLFSAIEVRREGITVTGDRMEIEPVAEMTPFTYKEGYRRVEEMLRSEKAPMYFDELELALNAMRDLWPGDGIFVQHARLVYDILWQLEQEGRLKKETRIQERSGGIRHRYYFWLED